VQLQFGLPDGALTGQVSDGHWTAELVADPVTYSKNNPAPQAGKYTLVIPGVDNSPAQPGGDGFGSATVDSAGNVSFSGVLADGTSITSASKVTGQTQWPMYASLYAGKGAILGWLAFTPEGEISGQLIWVKPSHAAGKYYPAGFTNRTEAIGSVYRLTNSEPVLGFAQAQVSLAGGNLSASITQQIGLGTQSQIVDSTDNKPAFTLTASTGLLTGWVAGPLTGEPIFVKCIVLQKQQLGAGFFLGTTQSGRALLAPAP
jgi:hypothetical protein